MSRPVVIIHFQPLELYPPIMNLIRYVEKYHDGSKVEIITSKKPDNAAGEFNHQTKSLRIRRFGKANQQPFFLWRVLNYFIFYLSAFCRLIVSRPSKIMYYETLSAYPVYLYRKYINRQVQVYIHYHEYTSKQEYAGGMKLARFFHRRELYLYNLAQWISHTNADRLALFIEDENLKPGTQFHVLPNYPPRSWQRNSHLHFQYPVKIIYTGALSMDTMFTRQFAEWVIAQEGRVSWHIYSGNISPDAKSFFQALNTEHISLKKGVDYYSLPAILEQYQVGIILYNGHIPNYRINAPNKLFEYHACGLDVWSPEEVTGCRPYYTNDSYPKVLPVKFQHLDTFNMQDALRKEGLRFQPSIYFCEDEYQVICEQLFQSV